MGRMGTGTADRGSAGLGKKPSAREQARTREQSELLSDRMFQATERLRTFSIADIRSYGNCALAVQSESWGMTMTPMSMHVAGYGAGRRRSSQVEPPLALTQRRPHFGHVDRHLYVSRPSVYASRRFDTFCSRKHVRLPGIGLI